MRVSTHIYGVSKEIDGKIFIFKSTPRHVTSQINHLKKMNPPLRVWTHMYGVSNEIHWKMFIRVSFLYIEMKELCEPSVNRTQFIFFTQFPLRWTSPPLSFRSWHLGWHMLDPPQSVSTDDILANLHLTALPLKK